MGADISPGIGEVFGAQRRVSPKQLGFGCPKAARLLQEPNWNARTHDAWLAAANIATAFNTGKCVAQVPCRPLQQLGFFSAAQLREELLGSFQSAHNQSKVPAFAVCSKPEDAAQLIGLDWAKFWQQPRKHVTEYACKKSEAGREPSLVLLLQSDRARLAPRPLFTCELA